MKHLVIITICMFCLCASVHAETAYIADAMKITLRTGPGINYKIITRIKSGMEIEKVKKVEQVDSGEVDSKTDWSLIRLPDGKEGWVLNRFITSVKPSRILLKELQTKYNIITKKFKQINLENKNFKIENKQLVSDINAVKKKLISTTDSYKTLKTESADFLNLKAKFKKTSSQLASQTSEAETVEQELSELAINHNIRWFITGAVVLLIGVIIGYSSKRQKRRTSLL